MPGEFTDVAVGALNPTYCEDCLVPPGCPRGIRCGKRHDIQKCSCGLVLLARNYMRHIHGMKHRELFRKLQAAEAEGRANAQNNGFPVQAGDAEEVLADPITTRRCDQCRQIISITAFTAHLDYHARRDRRNVYEKAVAAAELNKQGIVISGEDDGVDFGLLDHTNTSVEITITVENTTRDYAFYLTMCRMRSSASGDEPGARFSARLKGNSKVVKPNKLRTVSVVFHPSYAGQYEDTLEFVFWHLDLEQTFVITRRVKAVVGVVEDYEQIRPKEPYTGSKQVPRFDPQGSKIVPSLRPPTWTQTLWTEALPKYPVPRKVIDAAFAPHLVGTKSQNAAKANVKRLMPAVFNAETYGRWWQLMLYIEEEQVARDLEKYAMENVELVANYPRYELAVPGLAENRPSVLVGDYILVSHADSGVSLGDRTWYRGRVHDVKFSSLVLIFGDGFSVYRGTKFDVRFQLNRLTFRRMHHALVNKNDQNRILFPSPRDIVGMKRVTQQERNLTLYNRKLGDDEEQLETVAAILQLKPGSVPFVVFGPPGTGKTVTIVEAMQQLLEKDENIRILACAPSNSAADLLAQKLSGRGKGAVLRLNALSRKYNDLPVNLREFSCINGNKVFAIPPIEELLTYRVIVSTCLTGASPASMGMPRGHFSHIFIDEAGQGKEPEVILPIKSLADSKTNIILAGDHKQLGPMVHSSLAGGLGLGRSFLARITDREIYDLDNGGSGVTIVKLVKNFRSHPAILTFSNEQFYGSELRPCGDPVMTRSLEMIEELPKKRFPLIFHGIVGKDDREASSPSFFNIDEASQVKKYCKSLLENSKYRLKAEHIGVITPYHAQRCKISNLLGKEHKMKDIKVGSVEEFQGQERRVIIISTVRSNKDYITSDIARSLGFVANSRRMNVAVTRAQALLIVIGNPLVLSLDPLWRSFMNFIHSQGGWRGKEIDWNPEEPISEAGDLSNSRRTEAEREMEDTVARLKSMILQRHEDSDFGIDLEDSDDEDDLGVFERPILREAE